MLKNNSSVVLRKIGEIYVLVPIKKIENIGLETFLITNQTGSEIWNIISNPVPFGKIVDEIMELYELDESDREMVNNDVDEIIKKWLSVGFCEEV